MPEECLLQTADLSILLQLDRSAPDNLIQPEFRMSQSILIDVRSKLTPSRSVISDKN